MLADKDRIFTNLYGMFDRSLAGARARGQWDDTAGLIGRGRDKIVEEMKASGLRGPGRRGVPDRAEVVVHAEAVGRAAALSGGERRRIRARDLQGPRDHAARSAHADRGVPDRRASAMGAHAGYIYIRGEYIREREALQVAIDECYDAGLLGRNAGGVGVGLRPLPAPWRRRLHLRRGDGAAREPGGAQGDAAAEAAFPCEYGALRLPDHGQQRRVDRGGADDPAAGAGLVRELRAAEQRRDQGLCGVGACEAAVRGRGRDVDHAEGSDRQALRRGAGRLEEPEGGDSGRGVGSAAAGKCL